MKNLKRWCCEKCGYVHSGENPPMQCPQCDSQKDAFVYRKLKRADYAKLQQTRKKISQECDVLILGSGLAAFVAAATIADQGASVIMLGTGDAIGSGNATGISAGEQQAAYDNVFGSLKKEEHITAYEKNARDLLDFLQERDILTIAEEVDPAESATAHPWQEFSESTMLEEGMHIESAPKHNMLHKLAHWCTNHEVRMLMNHEIINLLLDENNVVEGVTALFNEKEKAYKAQKAVISFLEEDNERILKESGEDALTFSDIDNFYLVEYIPHIKATQEEIDFWGKDCCIGPAMVSAYVTGLSAVNNDDTNPA